MLEAECLFIWVFCARKRERDMKRNREFPIALMCVCKRERYGQIGFESALEIKGERESCLHVLEKEW